MMLLNKSTSAVSCRGLRNGLPARLPKAAGTPRSVVVRFREEQKSDVERLEQQLSKDAQTPTDAANKFTPEQIEQVSCDLNSSLAAAKLLPAPAVRCCTNCLERQLCVCKLRLQLGCMLCIAV
jgi:Sec-independent protein translocase protein TatA